MKNKLLGLFIGLCLCGGLSPLCGRENISVKEDVFVAKDEVQDNIISFGGNVTVEGRVKENIVAFGGTITLSGEVGDTVVGIGSVITLHSTTVIKGDLVSLGGVLNKEPGCVIQGDTVYFKSSEFLSRIFRGGLFSVPLLPIILILKLLLMFIWLLLALVVAGVFPRQLALASSQVRVSFWPVVGTGALSLIMFVTLILFSAFLSLILIGIPFLLFLIAVGLAIKIFGQVVLFHFFGESLGKALGIRAPAPLLAVVLGLIVVSLITFIPFVGFLFSFCLSLIAWGVVIRTKFGSTENWFRRKA
ncbi:MAG: hypothetical protein QHH14_00445 [Clostridiales bacterium]|nr:hypothetical protein [Clostridiales bacterium]